MDYFKEFLDTFRDMSALKTRTEDVADRIERIASVLQDVLQRVTRLEGRLEELRSSVKAEILADVKSQVAETRLLLHLFQTGELRSPLKPKMKPKRRELPKGEREA